MSGGVFAELMLWGGRLLEVRHQSSRVVCHCWLGGSLSGGAVTDGSQCGCPQDGAHYNRCAGLQQCKSFVDMCIVSCLSASPACVCGQRAATRDCPCCGMSCSHDSPDQIYWGSTQGGGIWL
jgi:hypothetical protein